MSSVSAPAEPWHEGIRIVVGDDHPIVAAALAGLVERAGHTVLGGGLDLASALEMVRRVDADVCLFGLDEMTLTALKPSLEGVARATSTVIVLLCPKAERSVVEQARLSPVGGIATMEDDFADIVRVVSVALERRRRPPYEVALSPSARAALDSSRHASAAWSLTSREQDILRRLAAGQSTSILAKSMGVRVSTVRTHVSSVLRKLDAHSRVEAVAIARRIGLLDGVTPENRSFARQTCRR